MATNDIPQSLERYQSALQNWEKLVAEKTAMTDHCLEVLRIRDVLQIAIQQSPTPGIYTLQRIQRLDQTLRQQVVSMGAVLDFEAYRHSFSPPETHWWWSLDTLKPPHRQDRLDLLFRVVGVLLWTLNLGLLGDISRRFFLGGPGVTGISAIALSSLLTLLNARSELTLSGQKGFKQMLERLGIASHWHEEAKLSATGLIYLFLLSFWLSLPAFSNRYNRLGTEAANVGRLGSAEQNYQRAIALDPDNVDAHYNLGTLYEDQQQLEQAQTQYLIAVRGDVPEAYNNLGHLYLLPDNADPAAAVPLLSRGLAVAAQQEDALKKENSFFNTRDYLNETL